MPKQDSKKKEYRVFLPIALSEEIDRLVDNRIYDKNFLHLGSRKILDILNH